MKRKASTMVQRKKQSMYSDHKTHRYERTGFHLEVCRDEIVSAQACKKGKTRRKVCIRTRFADVPFDIICNILARLPIEDILRCMSMCQSWYKLIRLPHFIELQRDVATSQLDRIILQPRCHKDYSHLILIDKKGSHCVGRKIPPATKMDNIVGSCNGLLCRASMYRRDPNPICIYNPITKEHVNLPSFQEEFDDEMFLFGFGFDSVSKKYKVICVYRQYYWYTDYLEGNLTADDIATQGRIITVGECSWRELDLPYNILFDSKTVFLNGAFYWMIDQEDPRTSGSEIILTLDINSEKFNTPAINFPSSAKLPDPCDSEVCLINLAGFLTLVETDKDHNLFRFWKIGDHELLSQYTCQLPPGMCDEYFCNMLGMLDDQNYLYQATNNIRSAKNRDGHIGDHLAVYKPQEKSSSILELSDAPTNFHTYFLVPTLVSPIAYEQNI